MYIYTYIYTCIYACIYIYIYISIYTTYAHTLSRTRVIDHGKKAFKIFIIIIKHRIFSFMRIQKLVSVSTWLAISFVTFARFMSTGLFDYAYSPLLSHLLIIFCYRSPSCFYRPCLPGREARLSLRICDFNVYMYVCMIMMIAFIITL